MKLCLYPAHVDIPWVQNACPKLFELLAELGVTPEPVYWENVPAMLPPEPSLVWISSQLPDRPLAAQAARELGHVPFYNGQLVNDDGGFGGVEPLMQRVRALAARPAS
jgi:hypothetical protein